MRTRTALALTCAGLLAAACGDAGAHEPSWASARASPTAPLPEEIEVPPPPFSEGVFPCTDCHDPTLPMNLKRRKLQIAHQEIDLQHDAEHRWCLDCHSASDRDKLHLAGGELIEFTESYKLCGQCHGDKYRDWRAGVHGRRSGNWDGHKTYLLCVNCHNAHSPAFKPLKPLPPPARPHGGDQ
jgi:formate-dependent nitrite reductase cytochrome c552 subunit